MNDQSPNPGPAATGPVPAAEAAAPPASRPGALRRLWRWFWTPSGTLSLGALLIVGFFAGIAFWGGFHTVVEATNSEAFCISCHEMEANVFREYRQTVHYTNRTGVRAVCTDCHVPKDWRHKMVRKVQASNELLHHFLGSVNTPEKFNAKRLQLATNVWRTMKTTDSRECRNCHDFIHMDWSVQEKRSAEKHQEAVRNAGTCIDCHRGIAHRLPPGAQEAADKLWRELSHGQAPAVPAAGGFAAAR
ncbi:Denitrification system component NirT [Rhodoplanes serenus]|uniref:Cytochrome c-type protein NapC n=1 Tax=Rhodoplanes serenus TaxID=200615 RepID=A0A327KEU7_9BRAD|nr:NapC/NirT family cytochrome c [Rhodoplanes serenus]MTW19293.1 Denitrification system component NirT [Rhodoplanes serenus]RAI36927.1 Denitrification system component NirT [Rhodoplanes serenus]VCU10276.1 Cytochrome c-type protein NapC [Rhodoplanes serenus]